MYVLSILLLAVTGFFAERRQTRHSVDILIRRVETILEDADGPAIEESCRKSLYHLDALRGRFGRVHVKDQIVLDSTDEERILMQAMGLAGVHEARKEFWNEKWNALTRAMWKKVLSFVYHSLPWGLIIVTLWYSRRRLWRALVQYDAAIESRPADERLEMGKGKALKRVHSKLNR